MSTVEVALIVGGVLGVIFGVQQVLRISSGENRKVIRNPDGSIYGGFAPVILGVVALWFGIGFGIAFGLTALARSVG